MKSPFGTKPRLQKILNLLYPNNCCCVCCGDDHVLHSKSICENCFNKLSPAPKPRYDIPLIEKVVAPFEYEEPIRSLIHQFKYENKRYLAHFFAEYMMYHLPSCDIVCPVPLHPLREKERGFSQTNLLCMALSEKVAQPIQYDFLMRIRHTPSQTTLSASDRKSNLSDAFQVLHPLPVQSVCLIDDVATTGSTLFESAKALHDIGISQVTACVIAY